MVEKVSYSLSCDQWGDGKSVCLWRGTKTTYLKIARFQSDEAARLFAADFDFPLSPNLAQRLKEK